MTYLILIAIGILTLLILSGLLAIKTYNAIRVRGAMSLKVLFNVTLIVLFVCISVITLLCSSHNYFYQKGANCFMQKNYQQAAPYFDKALAIRIGLGRVGTFFEKDRLGFPLLFVEKSHLRLMLADSYKYMGKYKEAIQEYRTIIAEDNFNVDTVAGLAESFVLTRDFEKGRQYYFMLTQIKSEKKDFNYYFQLGKAYLVLLKYEEAIASFRKALEYGEKEDIINRYIEICLKELKP